MLMHGKDGADWRKYIHEFREVESRLKNISGKSIIKVDKTEFRVGPNFITEVVISKGSVDVITMAQTVNSIGK